MARKKGELTIPAPASGKQPVKASAYGFAQTVNGTLIPMFPYTEQGSIVPAVTLNWGRPDGDYGFFMHDNTVEEVAIVFGGSGATGRGNTGIVRLLDHVHGVGRILKDPDDPEAFTLVTITQRQSEDGPQHESVWFICENCKDEIGRNDFDSNVPKKGRQTERGKYPAFETVMRSAEVAEDFNQSEETRTCPKCGHLNAPFPVERWGWSRYVSQTLAVQRAREALDAVIQETQDKQKLVASV